MGLALCNLAAAVRHFIRVEFAKARLEHGGHELFIAACLAWSTMFLAAAEIALTVKRW